MITVDLRTKVLPTGHRVYMVRPGAGYHLFEAVRANEAIAPDLADLDIVDGTRPRDADEADFTNQIKRARALAAWSDTEETRARPMPSRQVADYAAVEAPTRLALYRNTADLLLHGLEAGSLIYVPNRDLAGDAIFGELADADAPRARFPGTGDNVAFSYLGRRLSNVKQIPMRRLPPGFYESTKRRVWTHEFGARESELIYRQYYGDFEIVGQKAVTEIKIISRRVVAPDLSIIAALTNLVDQSVRRIEQGDQEGLRLSDVVFLAPDADGPIIHANLGSPGEVLIEATHKAVPRIVKVLVALAVLHTGAEIFQMVMDGELHLFNSLALAGVDVDVGSIPETEALFFDFIRNSGYDSTEELVGYIRETHERTGAEVDAVVTEQQ